ncbi:unnamed protein product [Echinostoma caproni]|uniref:HATPase_c domain-containing protein n=1 Tax=Echinostoma caproni TaxID=27848 RepID=A0A183ASN7_9TREM|nr:unnamed protein product [Echinostoma caproni]
MRFSKVCSQLAFGKIGSRGPANLSTVLKSRYFCLAEHQKPLFMMPIRCLSAAQSAPKEDYTLSRGTTVKKKFQAETQKLLDIVAKSLYSEKEVFIRELVSNASDAIERLRFQNTTQATQPDQSQNPMEIRIRTDKSKKLLIIEDTGIGMTREEMEENLGTIARSGSREFLSGLKEQNQAVNNTDIIGQFGVGFYATFMVADKVEVYSRSQSTSKDSTVGYRWSSTGHDGEFEMCEVQDMPAGTKIVLHLKGDSSEFADEEVVDKILRKYSNFVTAPIFLNDRRINVIEPTWVKDPSKYLCGNTYDSPRYSFMYKTDAPINLRVLLYVPSFKPSLFDVARDNDSGVALYSRKLFPIYWHVANAFRYMLWQQVLILNRTGALLPKWLRFMRGVVDSEDVPLNLSRELLQDSALINRIKRLLTGRIIQFFSREASRDAAKFDVFLNDFGLYLKEGLITEPEHETREQIARLLRWESSALPVGQKTGLDDYVSRMAAGERSIYFLSAPSRQLAECSPYLEAVRKKATNTEVRSL